MRTLAFLLTLLALVSCPSAYAGGSPILAPNLNSNVTGTAGTGGNSGHAGLDVNLIGGTISGAANVSAVGAPIPSFAGMGGYSNAGGNLEPAFVDSAGNQSVDIEHYLGAAFSASNAPSCRLTNGTSYVDPTQIRALTSADIVSAVESGAWNITNITGTISLPTGASTSANQSTEITSLGTIATNSVTQATAANQTAVQGTVGAGTAATKSELVSAIYNSSPITLTTGQGAALQSDASGYLKVNLAAGSAGSNASVSTTGTAVPGSATYLGVKNGANMVAITQGAATTANSIPVNIASDQTVTTTDAADGSSTGGTAGTKSAMAGGLYNTSLPTLTTGQQAAIQLDSNGRQIMGTSAATIGSVKITDGTNIPGVAPASTAPVATQPALVVSVSQNSPGLKPSIALTGSGSGAAATVSTVVTLTAPSNAIGFILQNLDTSTANIRWAVGRTASATLGQQAQPGRDTGFVPIGANVSICAESGTQNYDVQWIAQ
jgi:hypothetical protein